MALCMPNEVHPAYADEQWLLDWLNDAEHSFGYHVRMSVPAAIHAWDPEPDVLAPDVRQHVITRRKAWGLAPYVGAPFVYVWPVGEDELGRMVGGEARVWMLDSPSAFTAGLT